MTVRQRNVVLKQMPEAMNGTQIRIFLRECQSSMESDRPSLVLDCSLLTEADVRIVHLLLACLEEAMKRNGDVRLAGVSPGVKVTLGSIGVINLFEIFDSNAEAINSFFPRLANAPLRNNAHADAQQASETSV
ncbi:MAG: STAS domain-containing protein [Terracidiphilus sp.]